MGYDRSWIPGEVGGCNCPKVFTSDDPRSANWNSAGCILAHGEAEMSTGA